METDIYKSLSKDSSQISIRATSTSKAKNRTPKLRFVKEITSDEPGSNLYDKYK